MKSIVTVVFSLLLLTSTVFGQIKEIFEEEPTEAEIGAPLYPGAVFIRKTVGLDPYHETAMYISLLPMKMIEAFFEKKLPEKRVVYYDDEKIYLTAFLLKTWSRFPGKPARNDLSRLESEPNIQIRFYDPNPYEPLAEYFEKRQDGKIRTNAIRNGKTMILYTYEKSEEYKSSLRIIAKWREVSRDLEMYYGSILEFKSDGTYTFTFTQENLDTIVRDFASSKRFKEISKADIKKYLEEINPEIGRYVIMKNTITMSSENPVDGIKTKSGLAHVGSATLTLELINKPRLTFMQTSIE
ncbi:MAG TPA: hypothetical protein ENH82_04725 [bacterium]|nr:hypothetical protein [bacterium]